MWLPSSLYESLPWAYVLIGVLFIGGVYYIGDHHYGMLVYLALGIVCIAGGIGVARWRANIRRATRAAANQTNATD
ncbi:hypothetical protein [Woeseia oceani]|uniref:Uncharacterized protein n=1 Tax=Woeseia oceani TaxID=1548547 RepID=A0A193LJ54_9GAMM|nr:hypothetical protein [Woeseia oceani]ANO52486.1 hypothetical protein BA177_16000 [Woeseia oceani]